MEPTSTPPQDFDSMFAKAKAQLALKYDSYDSSSEVVRALAPFASDPAHRAKIVEYIKSGFPVLHEEAEKGSYKLINTTVFGALALLAAMVEEKSLAPLIYQEFLYASDDERDYDVNVAAGTFAVSLSLLDYPEAIPGFDTFLKEFEYRYIGEEFVLKTRYARWMLLNDVKGAMQYLEDPRSVVMSLISKGEVSESNKSLKKSLKYVAAALADLNAKEAVPLLKDFSVKLENPAAKEAFAEAIQRLEAQTAAPEPKQRMIWLTGTLSPNEMAMGGLMTDDEFVRRAKEKTGDKGMGYLVEADESAPNDM